MTGTVNPLVECSNHSPGVSLQSFTLCLLRLMKLLKVKRLSKLYTCLTSSGLLVHLSYALLDVVGECAKFVPQKQKSTV